MLMGRFIFVIPLLAVAGSLAQKKLLAPSAGTFPTNRPLFVGLLVGVVLIIGGHLPDESAAVRRSIDGCHPDHGWSHLFPGDIAWAGRRAGRYEPGQALPGAVSQRISEGYPK